MTADEIRTQFKSLDLRAARYDEQGELGATGDIQLQTTFFLSEIAAQLAELNQKFKAGGEGFNISVVETPTITVEGHIHPHAVNLTARGVR